MSFFRSSFFRSFIHSFIDDIMHSSVVCLFLYFSTSVRFYSVMSLAHLFVPRVPFFVTSSPCLSSLPSMFLRFTCFSAPAMSRVCLLPPSNPRLCRPRGMCLCCFLASRPDLEHFWLASLQNIRYQHLSRQTPLPQIPPMNLQRDRPPGP